jgi:hypothetical protein
MPHRVCRAVVLVLACTGLGFGVHALAAEVSIKLPKCASVKCRDIGCPADVLCVSGSKVQTCADVCAGH